MTRFQLGGTGGVLREVVGTAGAVGRLGVTGLEMQVSQEALVEYGTAIAGGVVDAAPRDGRVSGQRRGRSFHRSPISAYT